LDGASANMTQAEALSFRMPLCSWAQGGVEVLGFTKGARAGMMMHSFEGMYAAMASFHRTPLQGLGVSTLVVFSGSAGSSEPYCSFSSN
jgi:hypothetical protein